MQDQIATLQQRVATPENATPSQPREVLVRPANKSSSLVVETRTPAGTLVSEFKPDYFGEHVMLAGDRVYAGGYTAAQAFDVYSGALIGTLSVPGVTHVQDLATSADGSQVIVLFDEGPVWFDAVSLVPLGKASVPASRRMVADLAASTIFVATTTDLSAVDMVTGKTKLLLNLGIPTISMTSSGDRLFLGYREVIHVVDPATATVTMKMAISGPTTDPVETYLATAPDGTSSRRTTTIWPLIGSCGRSRPAPSNPRCASSRTR